MSSDYTKNHHLQKMTYQNLGEICHSHDVDIGDENLKVILRIMQENPYPVINESYHPVLLMIIANKMSQKMSDLFKPILEDYFIDEIK